jgi:hypothetical protein
MARMAMAMWGLWLLSGCAAGRFIAGALSTRDASLRSGLLVRRCGGCHEIPDPTSMSGAEWRASLTRMRLRMHLPESEWDSLATLARSGAAEARR